MLYPELFKQLEAVRWNMDTDIPWDRFDASQLSDGASATILMSSDRAKELGIRPLGIYRGFAVAGCRPEEMGIGPVYAVPKLLKRAGLKMSDIDIVELNEAFASQLLYCCRELGITDEQRKELKKKRAEVEEKLRLKLDQLRKEAQEEIFSVLTPAQRDTLKELVGREFEFKSTPRQMTMPAPKTSPAPKK